MPTRTSAGFYVRSVLAAVCLLACCAAWAQAPAADTPALPGGAIALPDGAVPLASDAVDVPTATVIPPAPPEPQTVIESCRGLSDKAMSADLKALTAQAQKLDAAALVQLHGLSAGFWAKAVGLCEGRAKERAQRNLTESQKASALLNEQLGDGPECAAAHKDAAMLQDMARATLAERRWVDAATLFHKSEDMWDLATERCTGKQKELAVKRQEQTETDGFNAEFCAPLFDRAREQTQKLRASSAGMAREEKQEGLMVAETLWRDALTQCKGAAAQDSARNNAQALARERGTPWVARNPATPVATSQTQKLAAVADKPGVAVADKPVTAGATATSAMAIATTVTTATKDNLVPPLSPPPLQAPALVAASAPVATVPPKAAIEPVRPQAQPEEFAVGDMRFKGQFVRDVDTPTFTGTGKLTWANGDVFEGTLQNGKRHGKGLFVWGNGQRYQGDWVHDVPSGQAIVDFTNGNHYEGLVDNTTPIGMGRMVYASGDTYSGSFSAGEPNGGGLYVWNNGQKFDGEWKSGKPNGQGKLQFANGDRYEGSVNDGVPSKSGVFTWANGDSYSGHWNAGARDGQGTFTWTTGDRWEGVYENNQQTSNGTLIRKSP